MSKHTPGPWKMDRRRGGHINITEGFRTIVSVCEDEIAEDGGEFMTREQEANARLIAAAPELLEALEAMLAVRCCGHIEKDANCAPCAARAAIAKARGEP